MIEAVLSSPFFGMVLCLASYLLGLWIRKKTNWTLANPLLIAVAVSISVLVLLDIPYESFAKGADVINWMLGPVTVLPGENEMEALAQGCLRVLRGEEQAHTFAEA